MAKAEVGPSQKLIKVSHKTIADMKAMGMSKAIERANSGTAGAEFEEGARRMYGKRIKTKVASSPTVTKTAEMAPKGSGHVYGEAAAKNTAVPKKDQYRYNKPKMA